MNRPVDLHQLANDVHDLVGRYTEGHATIPDGLLRGVGRLGHTPHSGQSSESRRPKPGSRPPATLDGVTFLALVETGVWQHDADLRDALSDHVDYERPWLTALASLPGLASRLPDAAEHQLTRALARDVGRWRNTSRVLLTFTVPMAKLETRCPYCSEVSLIVRADASSSVLCTTDGCEDERGDRPRWTRQNWVLLLEGQGA